MDRHFSRLTRRSAFWFVVALGLGGSACGVDQTEARSRRRHQQESRTAPFTPLIYTDGTGHGLAQLRPNAMFDITDRPGVAPVAGTRALGISITVWNSGATDLEIPPAAFALWGRDGMLYRPQDIVAPSATANQVEALRAYTFSADPIPPCGERFGWLHFRVPANAQLAGLLFTPRPERVLVVVEFSIQVTAISD